VTSRFDFLGERVRKAYNAGDAKAVAGPICRHGEIVNRPRERPRTKGYRRRYSAAASQNHPKFENRRIRSSRSGLLNPTTAVEDALNRHAPSGSGDEQNRYMVVLCRSRTARDGWMADRARPARASMGVARRRNSERVCAEQLGRRDSRRDGDDFLSFGRRRPLDPQRVPRAGRRKTAMTARERISWDPHAGKPTRGAPLRKWIRRGVWTRNGDRGSSKMNGVTHDGHRRRLLTTC